MSCGEDEHHLRWGRVLASGSAPSAAARLIWRAAAAAAAMAAAAAGAAGAMAEAAACTCMGFVISSCKMTADCSQRQTIHAVRVVTKHRIADAVKKSALLSSEFGLTDIGCRRSTSSMLAENTRNKADSPVQGSCAETLSGMVGLCKTSERGFSNLGEGGGGEGGRGRGGGGRGGDGDGWAVPPVFGRDGPDGAAAGRFAALPGDPGAPVIAPCRKAVSHNRLTVL